MQWCQVLPQGFYANSMRNSRVTVIYVAGIWFTWLWCKIMNYAEIILSFNWSTHMLKRSRNWIRSGIIIILNKTKGFLVAFILLSKIVIHYIQYYNLYIYFNLYIILSIFHFTLIYYLMCNCYTYMYIYFNFFINIYSIWFSIKLFIYICVFILILLIIWAYTAHTHDLK